MDIYVASISIDDRDPTNRIIFSQIINSFIDQLKSDNIEFQMKELSDPKDFERFNSIEDIPDDHILNLYINHLKENGNWASWMYDANVYVIAYAGYANSTDIPL